MYFFRNYYIVFFHTKEVFESIKGCYEKSNLKIYVTYSFHSCSMPTTTLINERGQQQDAKLDSNGIRKKKSSAKIICPITRYQYDKKLKFFRDVIRKSFFMNMNFLECFMNNMLYKIFISYLHSVECRFERTIDNNMTYMRHEISVKKTSTLIYF